jgi:cystathionine beta-lyase
MVKVKYNFNEVIERKNTNSEKWDGVSHLFQKPDLLPLWVADMDFRSPQPIIDAIIQRAEHGIYGYSLTPPEYYEATINWYKHRHGWTLEKDWFFYTPGVIPAINFTIQAFSERRDKIILQNPAYPPFFFAIKNNERRKLLNPLILNNGRYTIDFNDLEKRVNDPLVKILILCNPHNPTGRVWTKEELTRVGEICLENNVLVLADEIHCDLIYPGHKHVPFASISNEFAQNSVTCTSISKTFNLPGLKLSNIFIPNPNLRVKFNNIIQGTGVKEPNCFTSAALIAAYNECADWLDELMIYVKDNLEFLKTFVKENLPKVRVTEPEGTYLVWLDFRELIPDSKELTRILFDVAKVALFEGFLFGKGGKGFERLNLACPRSILEEALRKIANAVKNEL